MYWRAATVGAGTKVLEAGAVGSADGCAAERAAEGAVEGAVDGAVNGAVDGAVDGALGWVATGPVATVSQRPKKTEAR